MNNMKKLKKIEELELFKDKGIITDDEFESQKSKILNKKPFWNKRNILIISSATLIVVFASGFAGYKYNEHLKYIAKENQYIQSEHEREVQIAKDIAQKKKQAKNLESAWQLNDKKIDDDMSDFNDSAFGGMKYINMPDYNKDWRKRLDTIKAEIESEKDYTYEIKDTPSDISCYFESSSAIATRNYEMHFNSFVDMITDFNKQIDDYNAWAQNYIRLGGKVDYLDDYTANNFAIKMDFDGDGKDESNLADYLKK